MKEPPVSRDLALDLPGLKDAQVDRANLIALEQALLSGAPYDTVTKMPGWVLIQGTMLQDIEKSRERAPKRWRDGLIYLVRQHRLVKTMALVEDLAYATGETTSLGVNLLQMADIWRSTSVSQLSATLAEADILGNKLEKIASGQIIVERIEKQGRDALYLQTKEDGYHVAHEVKSVTTAEAASVDQLMMEAEGQHRKRLDEEAEPDRTWHKTTIVMSDPTNPWPSSYKTRRKNLFSKDNRSHLIRAARYRLRRLTVGAVEVGRQAKSLASDATGEAPKLARAKTVPVDRADIADRRPTTTTKSEATTHVKLKEATALQLKKVDRHHPLADIDKSGNKGVAGEKIDSLIRARKSEPRPEDRCMVVTERVRIVIPSENICIALDRTEGGYFLGHLKTMTGKAPEYRGAKPRQRQPRRLWYTDDPSQVRSGELLSEYGMFSGRAAAAASSPSSAAPSIKVPPLIAAKENNLPLVQSMIDFDPDKTDDEGRNVLHYAILHQNEEMVRFLCSTVETIKLWSTEDESNYTPLHYAYSWGNPTVIALLESKGAKPDIANEVGKCARDIKQDELSDLMSDVAAQSMDFGR